MSFYQQYALVNNDSNLSSDDLFQKLLGSKTVGASSTLFEQEVYSSINLTNILSLPETISGVF